jgi:hypothetical protein
MKSVATAAEIGRAADEPEFVTALQFEFVEQRQLQPHASNFRQEDAVAGLDVDLVVNGADRPVAELRIAQDDVAVFLDQHQAVRCGHFTP